MQQISCMTCYRDVTDAEMSYPRQERIQQERGKINRYQGFIDKAKARIRDIVLGNTQDYANCGPCRIYRSRVHVLAKFQMHPDDYDVLMLYYQDGRCALCQQEPDDGTWMAVDHDHRCCPDKKSCGLCVRALLCRGCNLGLGHFQDDPATLRRAADYIEAHAKAIDTRRQAAAEAKAAEVERARQAGFTLPVTDQ